MFRWVGILRRTFHGYQKMHKKTPHLLVPILWPPLDAEKRYKRKTIQKIDFTGVEIAWVDVKWNKYPLFHIKTSSQKSCTDSYPRNSAYIWCYLWLFLINFHIPKLAKLSFIAMKPLILVFFNILNVLFFYVLLLNSWYEFALIIRIVLI